MCNFYFTSFKGTMKNGTEGNGVVSVTSHRVFSLFLEELQFRGAEQVDG